MTDITEPAIHEELAAGNARKRYGLVAGALAWVGLHFFAPLPEGMEPEAMHVAAVLALMMIWWLTEAVPLAVTG
ncbi:MAG: hypothetical protein ACPG80_02260 [Rickettsiales bacterium]